MNINRSFTQRIRRRDKSIWQHSCTLRHGKGTGKSRVPNIGAGWCELSAADHGGCAVQSMNCLRTLEYWDSGFESYSNYETEESPRAKQKNCGDIDE
jgi:hypothetical protein